MPARRYLDFADAWLAGNPHRIDGPKLTATELDGQLHSNRLIGRAGKLSFRAKLGELPNGTFVVSPETGEGVGAALVWDGALHEWSPSGYGERMKLEPETRLEVLTPPPPSARSPTSHPASRFRSTSYSGIRPSCVRK